MANKTYVAMVKVLLCASDRAAAMNAMHAALDGQVLDWGFAQTKCPAFNLSAKFVTRAFPLEVDLPDGYHWARAKLMALGNQRHITARTEKELIALEKTYEEIFDQLGDTSKFAKN